VVLCLCGCVNVKAPESVDLRVGDSEPVDSSAIPETHSHEEARAELRRAYGRIQHLERENAALERKAARYKSERDECKDRLEKYEDD